MDVREAVGLREYNTFGFDVTARYFIKATNIQKIFEAITLSRKANLPFMILGGGSNIVLKNDYNGTVVAVDIRGREVIGDKDAHYFLRASAGENWHSLVEYCLENHYYGIENLSLIPGTVGAAPIQNIGAYGVELSDIFHELQALEVSTGNLVTFDKQSCRFGYRDSVFKKELKDQFVIISVTLKLNKRPSFVVRDTALADELKDKDVGGWSAKTISDAVCKIRRRRLPDPEIIGNAGSFFVNPVVPMSLYAKITRVFRHVPAFPVGKNRIKLSAGWLIEQCGYRGTRVRDAGVYHKNPLVLVNYGNATGVEILTLAMQIKQTVKEVFSVELTPEPRIY